MQVGKQRVEHRRAMVHLRLRRVYAKVDHGLFPSYGFCTSVHNQLLAAILRASDRATGVIGTLSGGHTTPEAPDLQAVLRLWTTRLRR